MTDLRLVECLLPSLPVLQMRYNETIEGTPAAGLMISVSNNGIDKSSQELKMISFDSVCLDCNVSTGCSLKVALRIDLGFFIACKYIRNEMVNHSFFEENSWLKGKEGFMPVHDHRCQFDKAYCLWF